MALFSNFNFKSDLPNIISASGNTILQFLPRRKENQTVPLQNIYDGHDIQKLWNAQNIQVGASDEQGRILAEMLQSDRDYVELSGGEIEKTLAVLEELERVHKTPNREALLKRLSPELGQQFSNRCFAQVRDYRDSSGDEHRDVLATIYMHSVNVGTIDGLVDPSGLTPLLKDVKNADNIVVNKPGATEVRVAMFYTVSANQTPELSWNRGGARDVIFHAQKQAIKEAREQGYKLITTTLSPMRLFKSWHKRFYPDEVLTDQILTKKRSLEYYLRGADDVGFKVHGPNGSILTEIKIDMNEDFDPSNKTSDPLQANHLYSQDREFLNSIRAEFNKGRGNVPMASHLYEFTQEYLPELSHLVHEIDHDFILQASTPPPFPEEESPKLIAAMK